MVHSLRHTIDTVQTLFEKVAADTQSPAFRQWFGASKVVDQHGDPLVVYHGTMFTFSQFSPGSHFGDREAANTRLTNSTPPWGIPDRFRDHQGTILPVYLSIHKPLRIVDRGREHDGYELADNARDQGAISDAEYKSVTETGSPGIAKLRLFAVMARHGYDGFVYRNTVEGSGDSWIPFQANQVKSVFNSGEWSQRSGNISETMLTEVELPDTIFAEAAQRLIDNIDWSGDGETVLHMMGYDEEDQEELDTDSPEFQAQLLHWAENRAADAFDEIDARFKGDVLRVYRMITAPPDWKPDPSRHPGEYWSWDERAADAHWGSFSSGHVKWLLIADVHTSQIDWVQTLAANGSPSLGEEAEITVRTDVPLPFRYQRVK